MTDRRWTLAEIKAANLAAGHHFFDPDTMRGFGDTMRHFVVRHVEGRVYLVRVQPSRHMPSGFDWHLTAWRLFDPTTGFIHHGRSGPIEKDGQ